MEQEENRQESEEIDRLANKTVEERHQGNSAADDNLAEDEDSEGWIKRAATWLGIKKYRRQAGPENVVAVAPAAEAPEAEPEPRQEEERGAERREAGEVIRSVTFWLNAIYGKRIPNFSGEKYAREKKEAIKRNFNLKGKKDLDKPLTAEKAQKAYAGYIVDLKKAGIIDLESSEAPWDEAHRAIKEIVENIDNYDETGIAINSAARSNQASAQRLGETPVVVPPVGREPGQTVEKRSRREGLGGLDDALNEALVKKDPKAEIASEQGAGSADRSAAEKPAEVAKPAEAAAGAGSAEPGVKNKPISRRRLFESSTELAPLEPTEAGTEAAIPLIMTRDMKQQLADIGMKRKDIDKLRPEDAWKIINGKKSEVEPGQEAGVAVKNLGEAAGGEPENPREPEKKVTNFSAAKWLKIFKLKVSEKVKEYFGKNLTVKMTKIQAVEAYVKFRIEVDGLSDGGAREEAKALLAEKKLGDE